MAPRIWRRLEHDLDNAVDVALGRNHARGFDAEATGN
jgi:hypothetical protein